MDKTAFGCQPDQQGGLQVPAAEPDQSLMSEFDSVLDEAGRASPNSAAADSADRSADQESCSDEYSEPIQDPSPQLGDCGTSPGAVLLILRIWGLLTTQLLEARVNIVLRTGKVLQSQVWSPGYWSTVLESCQVGIPVLRYLARSRWRV